VNVEVKTYLFNQYIMIVL